MYAVIKTGGKQYKVAANDKITIEKLVGNAGDQVQFAEVLMVANGGSVEIGAPHVAGATVVGEIAAHTRGERIIIMKKRRRKHYRRRNGHRQDLTQVTITQILTGGAKPAAKAKAAPAAAAPKAEAAPKAAAPKKAAKAKTGDNLQWIHGIGPKNEKALHDMGFTTFAQIAAWTPEQVVDVEHHIKLGGRVERENWIAQARDLAAGKPPVPKHAHHDDHKE